MLPTEAIQSFDCVVKYRSGAYTTNTMRGHRASSTMSAQAAAELLATKVFGAKPTSVKAIGGSNLAEVWRAER